MHKQQGFSLLEVLVTLVIVSFGLLGIAGALVNGMKNNQSSTARTQATVLANDIIDRMRANRIAAETAPYPYNLALSTVNVPAGNTIALNDLTQWRTALAAALPAGTGSVAMTSPALVTVVVQWNDARGSTDARGTDAEIQAARSAATTTVGKVAQQITVQTRL
jgi:type IV pilus assembly protein PilV